ncbi:subtilosin A family bacteriocin [Corynebacterium canis]|uniref:Subtilosin A family bacteriocin n=1 Tax=Corynebacterium canis TaxID=679663 RepID=A0A5C5UL27_9CORY|nr:subtilosin A family bacteriocin [Corynebacterium canis]
MYTDLTPAEVVNGSRCSACSAGAICALTGPIPDFEFGLGLALFHLN